MAGSLCQLVAGKAEKMATVVDELVHVHPADERGSTLLRADEIDGQEKN
jgi:hypothetical protein